MKTTLGDRMRTTCTDIDGVRNEVHKLIDKVGVGAKREAYTLGDKIVKDAKQLAGLRTPAPKWVGGLIHARASLVKHHPESTAIDHIDILLQEYHSGQLV